MTYTYDNANRLTAITQGAATVTIGYDDADRRTSLTYPNGNKIEYAYDAASQLTSITYKDDTTTLGDLTYTYDAAGNRIKTGGSFARTNIPPALSTTSYNANNQQTTFAADTLTYDLNGNLTSVTDGSDTTTYTWNARNQLTGITAPSFAASFSYDSFGRRIGKTVQGVTTNFVYDGLNPVQEKDGSTVTANLLTGLGIDEFFTRTDGVGVRSLLPDALGSTVALADNTGALQTQYTYEPFGFVSQTGAASTSSYKYTGREDDGTGLYYYRARYYQPRLQRFIAEDPIGFSSGDVNLYGYVSNNPIDSIDPLGLSHSFSNCFVRCAASHYGISGGLLRTIVGINAIPVPKSGVGLPVLGGASSSTNLLSYVGMRFTSDPKLGTQVLGTNRLFGLLGRLNLALGVGLLSYDLMSIGLCVDDCLNGEHCDVNPQSNP